MHTLTIVGRLAADPELRYTPEGQPVCHFRIADNGSRRDGPVWFTVSAWDKLGTNCAQFLSKGREAAVSGILRAGENGSPRVWTGRDGQARATYEVTAFSVEFLGSAPAEDPAPEGEEIPF